MIDFDAFALCDVVVRLPKHVIMSVRIASRCEKEVGMPKNWSHFWLLLTSTALIAFVLTGCFQPAGAGLEATNLAQALPTFTPVPTETPTDIPFPTDTPFLTDTPFPTDTATPDVPLITATPSLEFLETATFLPEFVTATPSPMVVADAGLAQLDPIWQTATAIYLQQLGIDPSPVDPFQQPTQQEEPPFIDPLLLTATQLVREATLAVEIPLTQTAAALFGPTPTPTFPPFLPTATNPPQVILPGNDCEHQVQPTDRNLFRLGLEYGIHYLDIAYYPLNNIVNPNLIYIGQKIIIPGCGTTGKIPPPTWTPTATSFVPTRTGGTGGIAYPTFTGNFPTFTGSPIQYTVRPGDTLFRLSLTYGVPIATIVARNPQITNINLIYVGDTLIIG
jgi:LysM repeat protein